MLNRYVSLAACLCLLASICAFGQRSQGTGYVFELPGPTSAGSSLQGFVYNGSFLSPEIPTANGPSGARQIIPKPDGSKFYILGANAGGLESVDPSFTTFEVIDGISGAVCTAAITPDGRYLLVGTSRTGRAVCGPNSSSNSLYILDTSTDAILPNTLPPPSGGIIGFAVSPDSSTAWMLTGSAYAGASVTAFSLSSRAETAALHLPHGNATSITLSPAGLLYVTGTGAIYEITTTGTESTCNPAFAPVPPLCVTPTGNIQVQATPGALQFTPSGQSAYAINTDPAGYKQSLLKLNIANHTVSSWPPPYSGVTPPAFSGIIVAGESLVYAMTTTDPNYPTTLWDVNPSSLSAAADTTFSMFPANRVISAAVSNEKPAAVYLYALVGNGRQSLLYRAKLADKSYAKEVAPLGPGLLQFVGVPQEVTGAVMPREKGEGMVSPSNQVSIVSGNGEFIQEQFRLLNSPLTIQVLSTTGKPAADVPVTFAVTGDPIGTVDTPQTTTNASGLASANFVSPQLPSGQNIAFDSTTVTASTPVGSVNFVETVFRENQNGTGAPQISVVSPLSQQLTLGEGDVLASGIVESILTTFTGVSQPVPNIGIRLASGSDSTQPGPASCQGSSLSDMSGLAHCNVYVSCQAGLGVVQNGINVVVGERSTTLFAVTVVPGTSQVLNIASGNNQTGNTGTTLPLPLVATVTDNCGNPHANVPVSWSVTLGSATLINTLSTSDAGGNVHTSVALGQSAGAVIVTLRLGATQVVFNLTNDFFALPAAFFTGEDSLGSGVYYLQLPNGIPFGYYNFPSGSVFYHYDMGFEAFIPGSTTDIYLYDFSSNHWLYTGSTLFPYLYDFTLKTWIYYFPSTTSPGHYTTNPRYFSNLTTGNIFTM